MFFEKGEAIRLSDAFTYPIPFRKLLWQNLCLNSINGIPYKAAVSTLHL